MQRTAKLTIATTILALISLFFGACSTGGSSDSKDNLVAATVNGKNIMLAEDGFDALAKVIHSIELVMSSVTSSVNQRVCYDRYIVPLRHNDGIDVNNRESVHNCTLILSLLFVCLLARSRPYFFITLFFLQLSQEDREVLPDYEQLFRGLHRPLFFYLSFLIKKRSIRSSSI